MSVTEIGGRLTLTAERVAEELDAGLWLRGVQICVVQGDETYDLAIGDGGTGEAVTPETVFKVYCAIKPITTLAIAKLVDAGLLDLDEPLGRRLPEHRGLVAHDITLRHVLSHTAGLHTVSTTELELLPSEKRAARLLEAEPPPGWSVGQDSGYSEFVGWHVLGKVIEQVTGEPVGEHLRESVLQPLGMHSTWLGMTVEEYEAVYERLGVNWRLLGASAKPMLRELSERWCCEVNCASGGYSCAGDQARLYAALLAQLRGAGHPALPSRQTLATFCSAAAPRRHDVILNADATHGLGFTVDLAGRLGGQAPSPAAFGHGGVAGSVFAFGDPTHDVSVGVVINGIIDPEGAVLRRRAIVQSLYRDLAIL